MIWYKTAKVRANAKFDSTPASETNISPFFKSRKFKGLTGTGLAQPIKKPGRTPVRIGSSKSIAGSKIVPMGSMWGIGFNVNLPARCAVVSPNMRAAYPCMTSWTITEKINITIDKAANSAIVIEFQSELCYSTITKLE